MSGSSKALHDSPDPHTIEIGGERVTAGHVLIATGGAPRVPPVGSWITSDEAFHLPALPRRLAILGAGYIAIEFAHIFAGFGVAVTLFPRASILRGFDPDLVAEIERGLALHGIEVKTGGEITGDFDLSMAAVGRAPVTAGLGLTEVGVRLHGNGGVVVDELSRTSVSHIFAVGDVTCRVALTPVAIREGHAFADTLFGGRSTPIH